MDKDLLPALRIVWKILSVGTVFLLLVPFCIPQTSLSGWIPPCEWQAQGKACPLCGMTTAFYLLSTGDVPGALAANPASLPLYVALVVNLAVLAVVTLVKRTPTHAIR